MKKYTVDGYKQKEPGGPRCPNHKVVLVDCESNSNGGGVGICPISGAYFSYECEEEKEEEQYEIVIINGQPTKVLRGKTKR
jgi:hypothetical protein